MRRLEAFASALCIVGLAGCATSTLELAPPRPDRPWSPATNAEGELIAGPQAPADLPGGFVLPANTALASFPPTPGIDENKVYSLPELIDLAESSNPVTRIAWNDARRVALATGIAQSTYLPNISASVVGAYQSSSSNNSVLGINGSGNESASGVISAVSLVWLLFDFGERAAIVEAAKQASLISNIAFTAAHQQVIYDVSLAFYANAAARTRLATATQSLKNAQAVQAAAEDRYKHGIGTVIEVAQARQATAQANLALVQATGGNQDAHLRLLTAMGISPLTKIKVADLSDRKLSPKMAASVDSIIADSLSRRPDMQSAYAAQKASLAKVRVAEAAFMPKFFVSATGAYNSGRLDVTALPSVGQQAPTVNINGQRLGATVFAGVTVPLYDGGTRDAMLAQARAEADSAEARLTRIRQDAVRQIVLADNALRTSLSAHDASEALVSAAQTTFDAALAAYRNGVGSITDVTLAETQLLQARNAFADAYSTALSAAATLALSAGALGGPQP
ncbi:TolC family protein [Variovorax sp. GT1P44]|uniref:TolC family protein n=1 Tax=Variovorax sp. GT1P44 TaxID=3443742 RepID=UPI003F4897FB